MATNEECESCEGSGECSHCEDGFVDGEVCEECNGDGVCTKCDS